MTRDDPNPKFRIEARELIESLTVGVRELDRGGRPAQLVALLRTAHTLKTAARMAKQTEIADRAHAVEDVLSPYCEAGMPISRTRLTELLRLVSDIGGRIAALEPAPAPAAPATAGTEGPGLETVTIEVDEIKAVLEGLAAGGLHLRAIREQARELEPARRLAGEALEQVRKPPAGVERCEPLEEMSSLLERLDAALTTNIELAERQLAYLRKRTEQLRLVSVAGMFPALTRSVEDAAGALGKHATFGSSGGEMRLDAHLAAAVREAVAELVGNALTHGIERPELRMQAGKPAAGRIEVRVAWGREGVVFACADDGAGLDLAALERLAQERGEIAPGRIEPFEMSDAIDLLLRGGISTASSDGARGFGLEKVRAAAARLRGRVEIESAGRRGTVVRLYVPTNAVSLPALWIESDGTTAAIPLSAVRRCQLANESDLVSAADGKCLAHAGRMIPFRTLAEMLHPERPAAEGRKRWTAVLVGEGELLVALGVERLHGMETILVRALGEPPALHSLLAGESLDAEGNPRPVLDAASLLAAAEAPLEWPVAAPDPPAAALPLAESIPPIRVLTANP